MSNKQKAKINWRNFTFFAATFALAVIGLPVYTYAFGVTPSEIWLFVFWVMATGLAITFGYHRLFAHRTFRAHPVLVFLSLFFGAAAFEESALQWTSQHRNHHRYVDTDLDPYNIKQGFFYAHIGWILFRNHPIDYANVKDLQKNKLIALQHRHYVLWAFAAGVVIPLALSMLLGGGVLGAFLLQVAARIVFVHHGTFLINSVCHYFGRPTYDIHVSAKDHWLVAFLTMGEGYHSFHHRFPSDYRNGVQWYHWDPTKWLIALLARMGLTTDLKYVSKFHILAARLAAEKEAVEHFLKERLPSDKNPALESLRVQYDRLKQMLHTWETHVKEYAPLYGQLSDKSDTLVRCALERVEEARKQFFRVRGQWIRFIQQPALSLSFG